LEAKSDSALSNFSGRFLQGKLAGCPDSDGAGLKKGLDSCLLLVRKFQPCIGLGRIAEGGVVSLSEKFASSTDTGLTWEPSGVFGSAGVVHVYTQASVICLYIASGKSASARRVLGLRKDVVNRVVIPILNSQM
jgi:hypothetical protein